MTARLLTGREVAGHVKESLTGRIEALKSRGLTPGLAVVLTGDDPASAIYVRSKSKTCTQLGIFSETLTLPADTDQKTLESLIDDLNRDDRFHGILVQLPLPRHLDEDAVIRRISPDKDVDGLHPMSVGNLVLNRTTYIPCTPFGIMEMFRYYDIPLRGKHAVIVGRSNIVGKPMLNLLYQKTQEANATVTICHTGTPDFTVHTRQADVLIAAAGAPEMITADMVKPGAVVIDVGINRVEDSTAEKGYRVVGDVHFESVSGIASALTPVPGGVGLMTIAMLMSNTVRAAELAFERSR